MKTNSESNQDWALDVYPQMCKAGEVAPLPTDSIKLLAEFLERPKLTASIKEKTINILKELEQLSTEKIVEKQHCG